MANEASFDELQELEQLLKADPELHFVIQTLASPANNEPAANYLEIDRAYTAHLQRMKALGLQAPGDESAPPTLPQETRHPQGRWLIGGSIAAAAVLIGFLIFGPAQQAALPANNNEVYARNGSKTQIVLPDSTRVWINSDSKVSYGKDFGKENREVTLTGEAYFDVTRNADKPFIIHTQAMDIRVLGTEFNVKSYPDDETTETSLIRGKIEVTLRDKRAEKIILRPNEKLVISNSSGNTATARPSTPKVETPIINLGHLNYFSQDSSVIETTWIRNRLVFEDESFATLAKKMERWYAVKIVFADDEVAQLRFTGNFNSETVTEALNAMKITANFTFSIHNETITITK